MFDGITGAASSGEPAGPLGCRGAIFVLAIVIVALVLLAAAIWSMLRDSGISL